MVVVGLLGACSSSGGDTPAPAGSSGASGTSGTSGTSGGDSDSGTSSGDSGGVDASSAGCTGAKTPSAQLLAAVTALTGGWQFETSSSDPCVRHQGLSIGTAVGVSDEAEACTVAQGGFIPIVVGLDTSAEAKSCANDCPLSAMGLWDDDSFNGTPAMKAYLVLPGGKRGAYAGRLAVSGGKLLFQSSTTSSTYLPGTDVYACVKK